MPLYAHVKEVVNEAGRVEAFEINYCTLYAHNGPYPLGGRCASPRHLYLLYHLNAPFRFGACNLLHIFFSFSSASSSSSSSSSPP